MQKPRGVDADFRRSAGRQLGDGRDLAEGDAVSCRVRLERDVGQGDLRAAARLDLELVQPADRVEPADGVWKLLRLDAVDGVRVT